MGTGRKNPLADWRQINPLPSDANLTLAKFQTFQGLSIFKNNSRTFWCFITQCLFESQPWFQHWRKKSEDGSRPPSWIWCSVGNNVIWSVDPENPTLEPNMKCIGSPVAEIWPSGYHGGIWDPHFRGKGVVGGQRWYHSKERWWFPIGSSLWPLRYL